MKTYDHIILGTGQATGTLLGKLIPSGESIAVIEEAKVGGSCLNYGCTPTKTLVASAKAFQMAKRGEFYGFSSASPQLNYPRVRERMNEIRNGTREELTKWIEEATNVDLIRERGIFTAPKIIKVGSQEIEGKNIYINVGTRPRLPRIEGIDEVQWMDSAGLLDKEELPQKLIILGGGYIGLEFAQVFNRFGSEVTVVQRSSQLMPREDAAVAHSIQAFLEEEGVNFELEANASSVKQEDGQIKLEVVVRGQVRTITGTDLLVSTGRVPNSDKLGLEDAGIDVNPRGFIEVDNYCRTGVPGVFALGDVNGHGGFTHTAVNDAEIVLDHLFGGTRTLSQRIPVYGLFTDPPLGRVGMTEKEALATGRKILKAVRPMSEIARAKEMGETKGFAQLLVDAQTDLIIGASILGVGGDEVINMFATIMHSNIPCRNYRKVVLVHPTVSELMPWILDGIQEAREEG